MHLKTCGKSLICRVIRFGLDMLVCTSFVTTLRRILRLIVSCTSELQKQYRMARKIPWKNMGRNHFLFTLTSESTGKVKT